MNKQQLRRLGVLSYESASVLIWGQRPVRRGTRLTVEDIRGLIDTTNTQRTIIPNVRDIRVEHINDNEVDVWVQPVIPAEHINFDFAIERTPVEPVTRRVTENGTIERTTLENMVDDIAVDEITAQIDREIINSLRERYRDDN